jgi:predicted nucleic acid-binding protein
MHNLFVFGGWFLIWPIYNHYNATGCYRYNAKVSDQTIYEFLEESDVSMSIVEYQKTILLNEETECTVNGEDVTENEVDVTGAAIETHSEDGELICTQNFATKPKYQLHNHVESSSAEHTAHVRTHEIQGYARNRNLFQFQTSFEKYIPLILVGMYPGMFARAQYAVANVTVADALYVISYPSYSGYKIDHDPVLTAYYAPTQSLGPDLSRLGGALLLAVIAIPIIVAIALVRKRRASPPAFNMR